MTQIVPGAAIPAPVAEEDEEDILPRHKIFADEWLSGANTGKRFNGVAAYEYAGYTLSEANPSANPSKLLRHPKVKAYISKRLDEFTLSQEEIMLRYSELARFSAGQVLMLNEHGRLAFDHVELHRYRHFIKSFGYDSNGHLKVEFHDPVAALKEMGRIRGMFKEGIQIGGEGGAVNFQVQFVAADGTEVHPMGGIPAPVEDEGPVEDFSEFEEGEWSFDDA